ncbi:unnamed protein product [Mycena citricolor]|uniref:Gylcosyl hydrolase 115 C-terminal domain-containing protein n=2 Tax=Mycena citricolor TaxID=2018698 RepID=A0AAD2HAK3_9AGAR|nr:unnamed protein product [Mycena citricolor]
MLLSIVLLLFAPALSTVHAIGQRTCVAFQPSKTAFSVVSNGKAAALMLSADEWPGVQRAAQDFADDVQRVTGVRPAVSNGTAAHSSHLPIIIGTLGKSSLIGQIVNATKIDVSKIENQWEAFLSQVVTVPGVGPAYVIIGADKRGTIFALYDHSEQIGVSPWYWWADVPTTRHASLFVEPSGCFHGSPTVKYRGIFLNDEQPALQNWAADKFTANGTGATLTNSPFNRFFYGQLFELLLRLKANHIWPAQWSSAFGVDDPLNQFTADYYGIVMGTSHEEPMMRSIPVEWGLFGNGPWDYNVNAAAIHDFWVAGAKRAAKFENMWTVGMRGNGDEPIVGSGPVDLLEKIYADQKQILADTLNGTIESIPQVWAMYKEVEGYYDQGLQVPDYITILWTDDNWGNVRRYPLPSERNRTGGAGVYYHIDYSSQISKIYEQMSIAIDRQATQIWVLNVGDLKPYERETEFFLAYGWDASLWNPDNLNDFVVGWAQREFDLSEQDADTVAGIVANVTRFNARCKPELLNATTYSLVAYREAETMLAAWSKLVSASTAVYDNLPSAAQPAYYETVHHTVLASANLGTMMIKAGQNVLRASQARLSTNQLADEVETLFENDFSLETRYHALLDGKWEHMMDQTHIGYAYWQQPMTNSMPLISRVQKNKQATPGPMRLSPEGTLAAWPGDNQFQCAQGYNCPPPTISIDQFDPISDRYIDIGAGGPTPFTFTVVSNASWLTLSPNHGSISPSSNQEVRVFARVDWTKLDEGLSTAALNFTAFGADKKVLTVNAFGSPRDLVQTFIVANKTTPSAGFQGFVEAGGAVSFEAQHATRNNSVGGMVWRTLPGLGKTLSGVTPFPRLGNNENNFTAGAGPSLEYDFYTFSGGANVTVVTYLSPSGNALGADRPLGFAVQLDDAPAQSNYFFPSAAPGLEPAQWNGFVAAEIIQTRNVFAAQPGAHTLKLFMIEPAVVVQKIVVDTGGVKSSYLGPPESLVVG